MSAYVFPVLPGIKYANVKRRVSYSTTILTAWSGKEVRLSRRTSSIVSLTLQVNFARSTVNAPAPWAAYTEIGIIKYFHSYHYGALDTWHILDPDGGADLVVRFAEDDLDMVGIVSGVWDGSINLVGVI